MLNTRRQFVVATAAVLHGLAAPAMAAEPYPQKPIRLIVPFAPGGASDFLARVLAPRLATELGQQVYIDNKAGAAGNIGMEAVAAAAADGYTAFLGNVGTLAINPAIFGNNQRVTAADLAPVSLVGNAQDILVVSPTLPVKTVEQLVAYARKHPGMSFASPASGSLNRLEMELFRSEARLEMVHIPYKGAGAALVDVVGGQVPVMFVPVPAALPLIKGDKLKPIAVAGSKRMATLPDVPTLAESGFPQVVGGSWQAVLFPQKTPEPVIARWHAALQKVLAREDVKASLLQGGMDAMTSASPRELAEFIQKEARKWGAVARASNATAD